MFPIVSQIVNKPSNNCPRLERFCQNDEISPNLVKLHPNERTNDDILLLFLCPKEAHIIKLAYYPKGPYFVTKHLGRTGRGGGQVVSVLAFYSDDPSSNPAEVYNFSVKLLLKGTKINKKNS